jgi:hypothetical protein
MGALGGFAVYVLRLIFDPIISAISFLDITRVTHYHFVLLGVFTFNLPSFLQGRVSLPLEQEQELERVRRLADAGVLAPEDRKELYVSIVRQQMSSR